MAIFGRFTGSLVRRAQGEWGRFYGTLGGTALQVVRCHSRQHGAPVAIIASVIQAPITGASHRA